MYSCAWRAKVSVAFKTAASSAGEVEEQAKFIPAGVSILRTLGSSKESRYGY